MRYVIHIDDRDRPFQVDADEIKMSGEWEEFMNFYRDGEPVFTFRSNAIDAIEYKG